MVIGQAAGVSHFLASYGYLAIFALVAIESIGIPVPAETTLFAASIWAGTTHRLNIALIILVAAAAAIIGDNIGYIVGQKGGQRLLRRYGHLVRLNQEKLELGRYLFRRHGGKVVFFGRFFTLLRTYAAFLAGLNRMSRRRFFVCNALGAILWATVDGVAAYNLGTMIRRIGGVLELVGLLLAVCGLIVTGLLMGRLSDRLQDKVRASAESWDHHSQPLGS